MSTDLMMHLYALLQGAGIGALVFVALQAVARRRAEIRRDADEPEETVMKLPAGATPADVSKALETHPHRHLDKTDRVECRCGAEFYNHDSYALHLREIITDAIEERRTA